MYVRKNAFNPLSLISSLLFPAVALYAFDPEDKDTKAAIASAVSEAVDGLVAKNKELLSDLKKLKKGAEIDPAEHERLTAERDDLTEKLAKAGKDLAALQKTHGDTAKALEGEQGYVNRLLVENGLTATLAEAGVKNPAHLKAAVALINASAKPTVKVDGETRTAMIGDKPLADYVKTWAASDEGKAFVSAPGNSGSGAQGGPSGGSGSTVGNMGGTPAERSAALAAKHPELAGNRAAAS